MLVKQQVLINVYYWMPDYNPRVHKFLNYWHHNIDAVISEVLVSHATSKSFRSVDWQSHLQEH
jgi:uncharacterized protein Usg